MRNINHVRDRLSRYENKRGPAEIPVLVLVDSTLPPISQAEHDRQVEAAHEKREYLIHCGPTIEAKAGSDESSRGTDEMPVLVIE